MDWTWFITVPLSLMGLCALGKWLFDIAVDRLSGWVDGRAARYYTVLFDMKLKSIRQDRKIDELQAQIQKLTEASAKAAEASRAVPKKAKKGGE